MFTPSSSKESMTDKEIIAHNHIVI